MSQEKNKMSWLKWIGYFFIGMDKHGWAVFQNFAQFGVRDVKAKKASAFVKSVELEETGVLTLTQDEIIPFAEQIVYRTIECRECYVNSKCEYCTCEFPSKMQTPEQDCPNGEWSNTMPNNEWIEYKFKNNIVSFELSRGNK